MKTRIGIVGAGCATVTGWALCSCMLARLIFTRKHERLYAVRSSWGCRWEMLRRMLRFGLPSGVNFFMEMSVITWFVFELGKLGEAVQAASNIAFSVNSVQFLPMLGLNIAVSSLVGQSMGRRQPKEAERITVNSLHLSLAYMLPCCLILALFPGPIMDLFAPGNMSPEYFRPIRDMGGMILRFIALYSLVDSGNIIFFGALKGAGDTLGVMLLYVCGGLFLLVAPILILKRLDLVSVEHYWMAFSAYVVVLAICAALRFFRRGWHTIRVIEQHAEE